MMKNFLLKYRILGRFLLLLLCAMIGCFLLAKNTDCIVKFFLGDLKGYEKLFANLFLLLLYLPIALCLWFFRNTDRLAQLKKADESNNFDNFTVAMNLFSEKDNKKANAIGLKLLMDIRRKKLYVKQIDLATQNSDLKNLNLEGADLSGGNFKGCDLSGGNFKGCNFSEANLSDAVFRKYKDGYVYLEADLENANFTNAIIMPSNIWQTNAKLKDLEKANLSDSELEFLRISFGLKEASRQLI